MKPWEETWVAHADEVWDPETRCAVARETGDATDLLAVAPEMARLLLEATEARWWNFYGQEDAGCAWEARVEAVLDKAGVPYRRRSPWDT